MQNAWACECVNRPRLWCFKRSLEFQILHWPCIAKNDDCAIMESCCTWMTFCYAVMLITGTVCFSKSLQRFSKSAILSWAMLAPRSLSSIGPSSAWKMDWWLALIPGTSATKVTELFESHFGKSKSSDHLLWSDNPGRRCVRTPWNPRSLCIQNCHRNMPLLGQRQARFAFRGKGVEWCHG